MRTLMLVLTLPFLACATAAPPRTVLFLCPHGGAKSLIAASYFNRVAGERGLSYVAVAAASEDPSDAVPGPVAGLLERDGFDVATFKPRRVEQADVGRAARVVTIDCGVGAVNADGATVERWDDVPKVSDDLEASAAAIRRHVVMLAEQLQ